MIYEVNARLIPERARELLARLSDGSIEAQEPDGREILASMWRARIGFDGIVRWTETCFCPTPLAHERETVLEHYFSELEAVEVDQHRTFSGAPLMEHLAFLNVDTRSVA
jgi:hypothetical protein